MDTKLKSNDKEADDAIITSGEIHKKKIRLTGVLCYIFTFIFLTGTLVSVSLYNYYKSRYQVITSHSSVLRSYTIQQEFERLAKNLHRYYIYYEGDGFEQRVRTQNVTAEELKEKSDILISDYNVQADLIWIEYSEKIANTFRYSSEDNSELFFQSGASARIDSNLVAEREEALRKLFEKYDFSVEGLSEIIISEKLDNYNDIENYLNTTELYYCFTYNNQLYTNIPEVKSMDDIYFDNYYTYIPLSDSMFSIMFNGVFLNESFMKNRMSGYIMLSNDISPFSPLYDESIFAAPQTYNFSRQIFVSLIFLILTVISAVLAYKRQRDSTSVLNALLLKFYRFQPFVIKIAGTATSLYVARYLEIELARRIFNMESNGYFNQSSLIDILIIFGVCSFAFLYLFITAQYLLKVIKKPCLFKEETEIKIISKLGSNWKILFKSQNIILAGLYFLSVIVLCVFVILCLNNAHDSEFLLLILASVIVFYITHRLIISYAKLSYYINEIHTGNISTIPTEKGLFSANINRLSKLNVGIKISIQEMIKSERLKAELITNVSHDLKTPLTAIMNYVELLKKTPSQSTQAIEYINILDQKSVRLKALIDDLFEASKLGSGNVDLEKTQVDIVNLLSQAMGELNEKIEHSGIDIKVTHSSDHIYMDLDGKKMWRVFENLLGNITKYSMHGSRAYISIEEKLGQVEIVFKNTSAYELNIEPDELFERFKRGDVSRTTDGNGLGLSIARNIIELHNGQMFINIDGDLFKVRILL